MPHSANGIKTVHRFWEMGGICEDPGGGRHFWFLATRRHIGELALCVLPSSHRSRSIVVSMEVYFLGEDRNSTAGQYKTVLETVNSTLLEIGGYA